MRKLLFAVAILFTVVGSVQAQTKPDPAETVRFLRQAWAVVKNEGPKALESAQTKWPAEIRNIGAWVKEFSGNLAKENPQTLKERAILMGELWRIRGSLNLLGLVSPESLASITGLAPDQLRQLAKTVKSLKV